MTPVMAAIVAMMAIMTHCHMLAPVSVRETEEREREHEDERTVTVSCA